MFTFGVGDIVTTSFAWDNGEYEIMGFDAEGDPILGGGGGNIYASDCILIRRAGEPIASSDPVNHPAHYNDHPSGVECIQITEHMNFCLGNAVKYLWRSGKKTADAIEDLRKAIFYIKREITRLENAA